MTNISNRISNEKVFPTKNNSSFPSNFHQSVIKSLHKQMFRIFAHVYWAHFEVLFPIIFYLKSRQSFIYVWKLIGIHFSRILYPLPRYFHEQYMLCWLSGIRFARSCRHWATERVDRGNGVSGAYCIVFALFWEWSAFYYAFNIWIFPAI